MKLIGYYKAIYINSTALCKQPNQIQIKYQIDNEHCFGYELRRADFQWHRFKILITLTDSLKVRQTVARG
jgi:hypothetical protein